MMRELLAGVGITLFSLGAAALVVGEWHPRPQPATPIVKQAFEQIADATPDSAPISPRVIRAIPMPSAPPSPPEQKFAPSPEKLQLVEEQKKPEPHPVADAAAADDPPVRHRNVCERNGGYRIEYRRQRHLMWRCSYPHRR